MDQACLENTLNFLIAYHRQRMRNFAPQATQNRRAKYVQAEARLDGAVAK